MNSVSTEQEMATQLLAFFGVASPESWENYYCNQQLKVAFRISLKRTKDPYAISAWLRKGELSAQQIQVAPYSEKTFREILSDVKSLMPEQPDNFFQQLQDICQKAGVKVVRTPFLQKAPINGATRWINDTPLIQLTDGGQRDGKFRFSFFHEAGHILLHGKKEIFLEQIGCEDKDLAKEKEADEFAGKFCR